MAVIELKKKTKQNRQKWNGKWKTFFSLGISGSILKLIQNYIGNSFQRVSLNGQTSDWKPVKAGVP